MAYMGAVPKLSEERKIVLPNFDNGHWHFPEQMGGKGYVGFIYVIRDKELKRFYLGKKNFFGAGKLNKGQVSNWRKYLSSSKLLAEMFEERPKEEFEFVCLDQYKTRGGLSYAETWSLCLVEAPTTKNWYNTLIEKVSWSVSEPVSQRHKERLQRLRDWDTFAER